jgi:hypothetical protein
VLDEVFRSVHLFVSSSQNANNAFKAKLVTKVVCIIIVESKAGRAEVHGTPKVVM